MAAPNSTEVGRKLRQHDHEFEAVYDLLKVIDGKVDPLDAKVDTLGARVETLDVKVDTLDTRVEALEASVSAGFEQLRNGQQQILDMLRHRPPSDPITG
ncbi:MAG: hypothetical protein ACRDR6_10725 [Pseudonocardiaceae bacterium]